MNTRLLSSVKGSKRCDHRSTTAHTVNLEMYLPLYNPAAIYGCMYLAAKRHPARTVLSNTGKWVVNKCNQRIAEFLYFPCFHDARQRYLYCRGGMGQVSPATPSYGWMVRRRTLPGFSFLNSNASDVFVNGSDVYVSRPGWYFDRTFIRRALEKRWYKHPTLSDNTGNFAASLCVCFREWCGCGRI